MPPLRRGSSMIRANLKNLRNANYFLSCKNKKEFHKHKLNNYWYPASPTLPTSGLKPYPLSFRETCFESSQMAKGCPRRGHHLYAPLQMRALPQTLFAMFKKQCKAPFSTASAFQQGRLSQSIFYFADSCKAVSL